MKLAIDCDVSYFSDFITVDESLSLFEAIRSSCTFSNVIEMADGTQHTVDAFKCMFADPDIVESDALPPVYGACYPWLDVVRDLKERVEAASGRDYNVCACIYYENGATGVAFHSDLVAFGDVSSIASVSLGQERTFVLRRIDDHDEVCELELANGSLLVMGEHCQDRYEHSLLVDPMRRRPRINLTFRAFGWQTHPEAVPMPDAL